MQDFDNLRLVYLIGLLILIWPGVYAFRRNASESLRNLLTWAAVAATVVIFYLIFDGFG